MNNNITNECDSNNLSEKYLEKLREFILDFETQTGINNDLNVDPDYEVLINTLNRIKTITLNENFPEIIRLSDASCIFLKYIKDARIKFRDEKILSVIKYIIYNFKSLFLNQKREDFELFIQYLNNPLVTFTNQ